MSWFKRNRPSFIERNPYSQQILDIFGRLSEFDAMAKDVGTPEAKRNYNWIHSTYMEYIATGDIRPGTLGVALAFAEELEKTAKDQSGAS